MSNLPTEHGTTKMLIQALSNGKQFTSEKRSEIKDILDRISIEQFLKALIADSDKEEVETVLSLIE